MTTEGHKNNSAGAIYLSVLSVGFRDCLSGLEIKARAGMQSVKPDMAAQNQ
jgi:hypothetical protein